jgi:pyruvate,water dikinase
VSRHLGGSVPKNELEAAVLEVTRGLPHNETTAMDLHLWAGAQELRQAGLAGLFAGATAASLARAHLAGELPAAAQAVLDGFLERYGARGLAEIDLGRPRWREDPTPVVQALQSYLHITDLAHAPDAVFELGGKHAAGVIAGLLARLRAQPGGRVKAAIAGFLANRARALMGMRESPKFLIVRMLGLLREALRESGRAYAAAGELAAADDVFFLTGGELAVLAQGEDNDWRALVSERRAAYAREKRRRQVPRLLLSDGRAYYAGMTAAAAGGAIVGSPVSPGVVEGRVRVVFDPHGASLLPGEILVCPGTDPSWTPLFLAAGGLVTEVGGLMTHGSVVAREYGIPAVVGVDRATERLFTGQRVRVDGTRGWIEPLAD